MSVYCALHGNDVFAPRFTRAQPCWTPAWKNDIQTIYFQLPDVTTVLTSLTHWRYSDAFWKTLNFTVWELFS